MSNNKTVQAMQLGAALRKERYEEILEDLYYGVEDRMNSLKKANPDFETIGSSFNNLIKQGINFSGCCHGP